jgi:hypothetical protein
MFAGDVTSIVERFNQPRSAIRELINESKDADAIMAGLTKLLAEQGVTSETLAASLDTNAAAYTNLGAQASLAYTNIGAAAAAAAKPIAEFVAGGLEGLNQLASVGNQLQSVQTTIFSTADGYDAYAQKVAETNAQLGFIGPRIDSLTRAQYDYAQALVAAGKSEAEALTAAQARASTLNTLNASITVITNTESRYADILGNLGPTMIAISAAGDQYLNRLLALNYQHQTGALSAAGLRDAIAALAYNAGVATDAQSLLVDQMLTFSDIAAPISSALDDLINKNSILSTIVGNLTNATAVQVDAERNAAIARLMEATNTEIATIKNEEFEQAILNAVSSSESAEATARRLAGIYTGVSAPALIELIDLLREKNRLEGTGLVSGLAGMARSARRTAIQVQRDAAAAATKLTTTKTPPRTPTLRAPEVDEAARTAAKIEDIQRDHLDKLRRMNEDYALSSTRKREDYEKERQRLLAEGNIREAQLLDEKFQTEQRRAAEDEAIRQQRERDATAQRIAEEQATLAEKDARKETLRTATTATAPGVPTTTAPSAPPVSAPSAGMRVRIEFAPIALNLDGERVATAVYPAIERQLIEDMTTIQVSAPPNAAQAVGVGGPRV